MPLPLIQIIDAEVPAGETVRDRLESEGLPALLTRGAQAGLRAVDRGGAEVVLLGADLPAADAETLLARLGRRWPEVPVVALVGGRDEGVARVRAGAHDFVVADDGAGLLLHVRMALAHARLRARRHAPAGGDGDTGDEAPVGGSARFAEALSAARRAGAAGLPLLITGEPGTGKDLVARRIHQDVRGREAPLQVLACESLPEGFMEVELAGYAPGGLGRVREGHPGRAALADGGTLVVEAPEALSTLLQIRLGRLVEDGVVVPRGATDPVPVDLRWITTSRTLLPEAVVRGRLRDELLGRLATAHVHLPPLRERREDIPTLAQAFLARLVAERGRERRLDDEALALLARQSWRGGNVRRLRHFVERLAVLCDGPVVGLADVERELTRASSFEALASRRSLPPEARDHERRILAGALERTDGDLASVARILEVSRRTLFERLDEHGLLDGLSPRTSLD